MSYLTEFPTKTPCILYNQEAIANKERVIKSAEKTLLDLFFKFDVNAVVKTLRNTFTYQYVISHTYPAYKDGFVSAFDSRLIADFVKEILLKNAGRIRFYCDIEAHKSETDNELYDGLTYSIYYYIHYEKPNKMLSNIKEIINEN